MIKWQYIPYLRNGSFISEKSWEQFKQTWVEIEKISREIQISASKQKTQFQGQIAWSFNWDISGAQDFSCIIFYSRQSSSKRRHTSCLHILRDMELSKHGVTILPDPEQ